MGGDLSSKVETTERGKVDQSKQQSSLRDLLKKNAESTATALSVFAEVAIMAVEISQQQECFRSVAVEADTDQREQQWVALLKAFKVLSSTEEGCFAQVLHVRHMESNGCLPYIALHTSVVRPNSACLKDSVFAELNTRDKRNAAPGHCYFTDADDYSDPDWLSGPVASSMFIPCPHSGVFTRVCNAYSNKNDTDNNLESCCVDDALPCPSGEYILLSPLLKNWMLKRVCDAFSSGNKSNNQKTENETFLYSYRRRMETAALELLRERLQACEHMMDMRADADAGSNLSLSPSPVNGCCYPSEVALAFLRDAVVWTHLRVPSEEGRDHEGVVTLVTMASRAADDGSSALPLGSISSSFPNDIMREWRDVLEEHERGNEMTCTGEVHPSFSLFNKFMWGTKSKRHGSVSNDVKTCWMTLHTILFKMYRTMCLFPFEEAEIQRRNTWRYKTVARTVFFSQPAIIFLCRHHSIELGSQIYKDLLSAHGWREWSDSQMFSSSDNERAQLIYTPLGYAHHEMPWLSYACQHSLLNGLLLLSVLHTEHRCGMTQRSRLTAELFPVARRDERGDGRGYLTKCGNDRRRRANASSPSYGPAGGWSRRQRTSQLSQFIVVFNGFLSALQDLGHDINCCRQEYINLFLSRSQKFTAEQERQKPSSNRRYRLKEWENLRTLKQRERDALTTPLLDRLLPQGSAVVSAESFSRLLWQLLEGGSPFQALRMAANALRMMRLLRRAARQPIPRVVQTNKFVHCRVPSRKNPFKMELIKKSVSSYRLTSERDCVAGTNPTMPTTSFSGLVLTYEFSEEVVEEMTRIGLRMGSVGSALASGVLDECVEGNVVDFVNSRRTSRGNVGVSRSAALPRLNCSLKCRGLPFPSAKELCDFVTTPVSALPCFASLTTIPTTTATPAIETILNLAMCNDSFGSSSFRIQEEVRRSGGGEPAVRVGQRIPPSSFLLETCLLHAPLSAHSMIKRHREDRGMNETEREGSGRASKIVEKVFRVVLADPHRFLTQSEMWFAVQAAQVQTSPRRAVEGLYAVMRSAFCSDAPEERMRDVLPPSGCVPLRESTLIDAVCQVMSDDMNWLCDFQFSFYHMLPGRVEKDTSNTRILSSKRRKATADTAKKLLRDEAPGEGVVNASPSATKGGGMDTYIRIVQELIYHLKRECDKFSLETSNRMLPHSSLGPVATQRLWALCTSSLFVLSPTSSFATKLRVSKGISSPLIRVVDPSREYLSLPAAVYPRVWKWLIVLSLAMDPQTSQSPLPSQVPPNGVDTWEWAERACKAFLLSPLLQLSPETSHRNNKKNTSSFSFMSLTSASKPIIRQFPAFIALQVELWHRLVPAACRAAKGESSTSAFAIRRGCEWYLQSHSLGTGGRNHHHLPGGDDDVGSLLHQFTRVMRNLETALTPDENTARGEDVLSSDFISSLWSSTFDAFFLHLVTDTTGDDADTVDLSSSLSMSTNYSLLMLWLLATMHAPSASHFEWMERSIMNSRTHIAERKENRVETTTSRSSFALRLLHVWKTSVRG